MTRSCGRLVTRKRSIACSMTGLSGGRAAPPRAPSLSRNAWSFGMLSVAFCVSRSSSSATPLRVPAPVALAYRYWLTPIARSRLLGEIVVGAVTARSDGFRLVGAVEEIILDEKAPHAGECDEERDGGGREPIDASPWRSAAVSGDRRGRVGGQQVERQFGPAGRPRRRGGRHLVGRRGRLAVAVRGRTGRCGWYGRGRLGLREGLQSRAAALAADRLPDPLGGDAQDALTAGAAATGDGRGHGRCLTTVGLRRCIIPIPRAAKRGRRRRAAIF
jgi:hypothetical protein